MSCGTGHTALRDVSAPNLGGMVRSGPFRGLPELCELSLVGFHAAHTFSSPLLHDLPALPYYYFLAHLQEEECPERGLLS